MIGDGEFWRSGEEGPRLGKKAKCSLRADAFRFAPATDFAQEGRLVRSVPILLRKSVAADGCSSVIRLRATGFDLPALTLCTQLSRYAMH